MTRHRVASILRCLSGLVIASGCAENTRAEPIQDVIVYSFTTDAGKKFVLPTSEKPAHYVLIDGGYREEGDRIAGEIKPDRARVEKLVRRALAGQHYLGATASSAQVDLLIVYFWGYLAPVEQDFETATDRAKRMALVGGKHLSEMSLEEFGREELMQAAGEDRYFVVISAYDFAAAAKKKKTLLWRSQISGSMRRTTLNEVLPPFLAAGAPLFGRDTGVPAERAVPLGLQGQVEVGTPVVEEYLPAVQLPPRAQKSDDKGQKPTVGR